MLKAKLCSWQALSCEEGGRRDPPQRPQCVPIVVLETHGPWIARGLQMG